MRVTDHKDKVVVQLHELTLGEALPWPVYDQEGNLLLNQGFCLANPRQRDLILRRGGTRPADGQGSSAETSVVKQDGHRSAHNYSLFELMEYLLTRLEEVNEAIFSRDKSHAYILTSRLALDIQYLVEQCADRLLALLLMSDKAIYQLIHPLHAAVCCDLLARELGLSREERLPLLCGALTHDLGIQQVQRGLDQQEEALSANQLSEVRKHPLYGIDFLQEAGIEHLVWLDVVRNHHERLDGSGYPQGLKGDQVSLAARILAICDSYSAMVRRRCHRGALESKNALLILLREEQSKMDLKLIRCLIKAVGLLAPGSLVRLQNGMVAAAYARGDTPQTIKLKGMLDTNGKPFASPPELEPNIEAYKPEGFLAREDYSWALANLSAIWPPLLLRLR